jgi:hypothetical protein
MVILNKYQYGQVLGPGFYHTAQVVLDSYRIVFAKYENNEVKPLVFAVV